MSWFLYALVQISVFAPLLPGCAALLLALLLLRARPPAERTVVRVAQGSLWASLCCVVAGALAYFASGQSPIDVSLGDYYRAGDYGFAVVLRLDALSLTVAPLVAVLLLATSRFSANYLHREPGFIRFFLLTLTFAAGVFLLVLAGSFDVLYIGWEVVGLTSVLLVSFFHERAGPVRAGLRVLVTYRLCDVGLLLGVVWLHLSLHTAAYGDVFRALSQPQGGGHGAALPVTAVGLGLTLAAMGKSAQFPVGGWLPRAMEGPTASSAVFYGSLSVHAGVFLLLRAAPLIHQAPLVQVALALIGLTTAVMGALSGQVSADAKSALVYATVSQVGLMFVEIALGLERLAALHLCAHALLRYYQFLRTPSALQDALGRRSALGMTQPDEDASRWEGMGVTGRRFLYRLALERFAVEASLERWLVRPMLAASRRLDRLERALTCGSPPLPEAGEPGPGPRIAR